MGKDKSPIEGRHCCLNCHYLETHEGSGRYATCASISNTKRSRLAKGEPQKSIFCDEIVLACHKGVWDSANLPSEMNADARRKILRRDRENQCFFYQYMPGMFFPAVDVLERRAADRREAERDRELTRQALLFTKWALIVSIGATILNFAWNVAAHFLSK